MNIETGEIIGADAMELLPEKERAKYIPFTRDLTAKEKQDMQIRLYAPCACGSGKKFKFCCKSNAASQESLDGGATPKTH